MNGLSIFLVPAIISTIFMPRTAQSPLGSLSAPQIAIVAEDSDPLSTSDLVKQIFGKDSDDALKVFNCESGLNEKAQSKSSTAAGVAQIIHGTWKANSDYSWDDRYDAKKNIETAYKIFHDQGWRPWECRRVL